MGPPALAGPGLPDSSLRPVPYTPPVRDQSPGRIKVTQASSLSPGSCARRSEPSIIYDRVPSSTREGIIMAKICQVSGKKGNNAKHIRNQHSQGWKYKA